MHLFAIRLWKKSPEFTKRYRMAHTDNKNENKKEIFQKF